VATPHAEERIGGMLDIIESTLAQHAVAGRWPFLLGAQYSAVDPYLLMLSRWTRAMGNPARTRPHLGKFLSMMVERPAVKRAFEMEGLTGALY
jgi:glutathione S-transferase